MKFIKLSDKLWINLDRVNMIDHATEGEGEEERQVVRVFFSNGSGQPSTLTLRDDRVPQILNYLRRMTP